MRVACGSKSLDPLYAAGCQTRSTARIAAFASQGCQTTLIESLLLPPDGASSVAENPCHIILIGPSLFNQTNHSVGFGHPVGHCILCQDNPGDDDDAVALLGSQETPVVENPDALGIMEVRK